MNARYLQPYNTVPKWKRLMYWFKTTWMQLFYFLFGHKTFQNKSQKHVLLDFQLFIFLFISFQIVLSSNKFFRSALETNPVFLGFAGFQKCPWFCLCFVDFLWKGIWKKYVMQCKIFNHFWNCGCGSKITWKCPKAGVVIVTVC